ncbi:type II secretion system F family protein [Cellvibrio fibrivorans]|uniref:General secretion pathway protein F n=1 Tax=Cellvibrio fibrivorans TaxID=126350 RepID=A0ABU1UU46_9GAMM|nr:type II secretion system F family protein [Cellvibrio fibrivorans]MDR7088709.1 general secretion pathway protein F [Cellvibrio fibrivorans]
MQFTYKALDSNQSLITGSLDAGDEREALRLIREKNLQVVEIYPQVEDKTGLRKKLTQAEITVSLFELTTMLDSGVAIADALQSLQDSDAHPRLLRFYRTASERLQQGANLGSALASEDVKLPPYFIQLIAAGEASGQLASAMRRGVDQMEYELSVANDLRNALIYPAVLVLTGISAVGLIFVFVVPKFANMLDGKTDLPFLAHIVLSTGMWLNENFLLMLAILAGSATFVGSQLSKASVRQSLLDKFSTLPLLGRWLGESDISRWSSVMGAMLASRVELVRALDLARASVKNTRRSKALNAALTAVQAGTNLSKALQDNQILNATAYNLVRAGEKTGRLSEMLFAVAKIYENSSKNRMKRFLLLIEPLAIVLIGIAVGVIILGLIQAITSVNDMAI